MNNTTPIISLPKPGEIKVPNKDLRTVIEDRKSVRSYSVTPLTLEELSYLLWCTQGVKKVLSNNVTFRTVPSAGASHAFETYILVNNVEGIQPGVYKFSEIEHSMAAVSFEPGMADEITRCCLNQAFILESAVTFIWVAVYPKMSRRYRDRTYKYLHLDAGHVCQNLYLSAESIGAGVCAIGAYSDDEINSLLGLDGKDRFVIYIAAVGKKNE